MKEHKPDSIANTPFKKLADVLATTRSGDGGKGGPGGKGGTGGQGGVIASQTEKPKDMNSHNGVEGTWSKVGDEWVFYSKNYFGEELKKTSSNLDFSSSSSSSSVSGNLGNYIASDEGWEKYNDDKNDRRDIREAKEIARMENKSTDVKRINEGKSPLYNLYKGGQGGPGGTANKESSNLGTAPIVTPTTKRITSKNATPILKQMMSAPTGLSPASDPNIRAQNMSGIHKQNFELKEKRKDKQLFQLVMLLIIIIVVGEEHLL